jgi:hypothetical protein
MASFTAEQEWYYLNDDAENLGPFTVSELAGFYKSSVVKDTTFVWHEDIKDGAWASANEVDGLIAHFKSLDTKGGETKEETKESSGIKIPIKPGSHGRRASVAQVKMGNDKEAAKKISTERRASMFGKNVKAPPAMAEDNLTKLKLLSQKKYIDQCQWFLNAYWDAKEINFKSNPEECERVWKFYQSIITLDKKLGADGNELDEFEAHIFLEKNVSAITVKKMRKVLADIDVDFNQKVSMTEFLIYYYKIDYNYLVNAVTNDAESERLINLAKQKLAAAQEALQDAQNAAKEASAAAAAAAAAAISAKAEAKKAAEAEVEAKFRADDAKKAADALAKAQKAAEDALAELEAQQKAFDDRCAMLKATSEDDSLGQVKRNKAKHELSQMKAKDPLPLDRAKINQGATVRKLKKAKKKADKTAAEAAAAAAAASEARAAAEEAAALAEKTARESEEAAAAAEAAVLAADKAVEEASGALETVKEQCKGNSVQGTMWWMDREWEEAKKYMSSAQIARLEKRRAAKK